MFECTIKEAKILFRNGFFSRVEVFHSPYGFFLVNPIGLDGTQYYLKRLKGGYASFKRLDSAVATALRIGFQTLTLTFVDDVPPPGAVSTELQIDLLPEVAEPNGCAVLSDHPEVVLHPHTADLCCLEESSRLAENEQRSD